MNKETIQAVAAAFAEQLSPTLLRQLADELAAIVNGPGDVDHKAAQIRLLLGEYGIRLVLQ